MDNIVNVNNGQLFIILTKITFDTWSYLDNQATFSWFPIITLGRNIWLNANIDLYRMLKAFVQFERIKFTWLSYIFFVNTQCSHRFWWCRLSVYDIVKTWCMYIMVHVSSWSAINHCVFDPGACLLLRYHRHSTPVQWQNVPICVRILECIPLEFSTEGNKLIRV